jgi:hypothetical protein
MMIPRPSMLTATAACFLSGAAVVCLAWLGVSLTATAPDVRGLLDLGLRPIRCSVAEAALIAANNLRLAAAPLIGAVVLARQPRLRIALDFLLGALLAINAAIVGAALAAYGGGVSSRLLSHGPLELVGFASAGGVYVAARRRRLSLREWASGASMAAAALIAAAAVEGTRC